MPAEAAGGDGVLAVAGRGEGRENKWACARRSACYELRCPPPLLLLSSSSSSLPFLSLFRSFASLPALFLLRGPGDRLSRCCRRRRRLVQRRQGTAPPPRARLLRPPVHELFGGWRRGGGRVGAMGYVGTQSSPVEKRICNVGGYSLWRWGK